MSSSLYSKLFLTSYYFTIAIRKKPQKGIIESRSFKAEYIMPATRANWCADPMLIDYEDKTYLFYEAVDVDHGRIEVVEVNDDCTVGEPTILLGDECHYSYPFVFKHKDELYMIPESSAANEVRLYKAKVFPYEWELCYILLNDRAVDTTAFEQDGKTYLLTFITDGKSERVRPNAYELRFENDATLTKLSWDEFDELRVRGAGGVFAEDGRQYRPAQISTEVRYGDALAFYEVNASDGSYSESFAGELTADNVSAKGVHMDGLHTYSTSEHFEAIDIRCREFDLFKVPRRILGALK